MNRDPINLLKIKEIFRQYKGNDTNLVSLSLQPEKNLILLTLNNNKSYNALTGKMMAELADCIDKIENLIQLKDNPYGGLILYGIGGNFCSGLDLSIAKQELTTSTKGEQMCFLMQDNLERILNLPLITIACIEGYAMGGGAELTTCTDFRIASKEATIRFVHRKIGTVPGWGGAKRLISILGYQQALYYLGTTKKLIIPNIGESNQFINLVSEPDKTLDNAYEFLKPFFTNEKGEKINIQNLLNIKKLMKDLNQTQNPLKRLDIEYQHFSNHWGSENNLNAVENVGKSLGKK